MLCVRVGWKKAGKLAEGVCTDKVEMESGPAET